MIQNNDSFITKPQSAWVRGMGVCSLSFVHSPVISKLLANLFEKRSSTYSKIGQRFGIFSPEMDREKRKLAHRNVSLIPLQFGEIIVEALEEGFPQPVGARSAARPLQIRSFRQRGELVSHLHRVFQIPVMQKVIVAPDLFLLRVRVAPKNVQQRDVVSLG